MVKNVTIDFIYVYLYFPFFLPLAEISDPLFKKSALLLQHNNNTSHVADQMGDRLSDHQEQDGLSLKIDSLAAASKDRNLCQVR